jgi:AraC-like DNA-binding protein
MNWYLIVISAAALQGLLLAFAIRKLASNKKSVQWLSALLVAISICLAGRIFYDSDLFARYPKAVVISDLMLFTYGPLILLYLKSIFFKQQVNSTKPAFHFLIAMVHVAWISQYLVVSNQATIDLLSNPFHLRAGQITEALGWCHIFGYLVASFVLFKKYLDKSKEVLSNLPTIQFLKYFFLLNAIALLLWITGYFLLQFNGNTGSIFFTYNSIWILLTCSVYMTGYYAIAIPDFFRIDLSSINQVSQSAVESNTIHQSNNTKNNAHEGNDAQVKDTASRLTLLMGADKPFLDPNLTLAALSEKIHCTVHLLSKVINESFHKNFFDYINEYRVNHFIWLAQQPSSTKYTLLSLAFESGFNSKSTFNSSFKKVTGKTPSQFLKGLSFPKSTD